MTQKFVHLGRHSVMRDATPDSSSARFLSPIHPSEEIGHHEEAIFAGATHWFSTGGVVKLTVKDLCRSYGISEASYYFWRSKFSGMIYLKACQHGLDIDYKCTEDN